MHIVQGLHSPAYRAGLEQTCVYCKAQTAMRIVQGLHSPAYRAELEQTCI